MEESEEHPAESNAAAASFGTGTTAAEPAAPPVTAEDGVVAIIHEQWKVGQPLDVADMTPGKTPISLLQESCTKSNEITPIYELLSTEGQVHQPAFMYRVTVDEYQATGQGKSKKVAKHLAAKGVMEKMIKSGRWIEFALPGRTQQEAIDYLNTLMPELNFLSAPVLPAAKPEDVPGAAETAVPDVEVAAAACAVGTDGNPVGRLQEMCMKKKFPIPEYELVDEQGMAHEKTFTVICRVGKMEETAVARNKKLAKRQASEQMLKFLKEDLPLIFQKENPLEIAGPDPDQEDGTLADVETDDSVAAAAMPGTAYPEDLENDLTAMMAKKDRNAEFKRF